MSWGIFSAEDFPKFDTENNCQVDYRQSLGVQVILHEGQWTELEDLYKIPYFESWIAGAGDGREVVITGRQVAERMAGDFGTKGIGCANLDKVTDAEKKAIEARCKENNMKWRRSVIDRFEQQFRTKTQGGPGRWTPNAYEMDCYQKHGLVPPDVVQRKETQTAAPVVIHESVDPEMLQRLVAAEMAKQVAAKR